MKAKGIEHPSLGLGRILVDRIFLMLEWAKKQTSSNSRNEPLFASELHAIEAPLDRVAESQNRAVSRGAGTRF